MSNDLRLNSLERFRKQSQRLVLEEYSHCEVPAGCGGVVMRWRDPSEGRPVLIRGFLSAAAAVFIDEQELNHGRTNLQPGSHVLALAVSQIAAPHLLGVLAWIDSPDSEETLLPAMLSMNDGTWKVTDAEPPENWKSPTFDDASWSALNASTVDVEELPSRDQWGYQRVLDNGANLLQLPEAEKLWVRKRFDFA